MENSNATKEAMMSRSTITYRERASNEDGALLESIELSRTYSLELFHTTIGRAPALALHLVHIDYDSGEKTIRGSITIFHGKVLEIADAIARAHQTMRENGA